MKALIDGDILLYSIGSLKDETTGEPLFWPLTLARLDGKIKQIVREAGADEYVVYVTGKGNFREYVATIKPYKGNRPEEKPYHYKNIKAYFEGTNNHEVIFTQGIEADDAMGIEQMARYFKVGTFNDYVKDTAPTIICSRDKDMKMIPGWHYEWSHGEEKKKEPFFINETQAINWFFQQLLTGDSVDNIPGLFGVGNKSKLVLDLRKMDDILDMYTHVRKHYEDRFGSYWNQFMVENARLLWIHRQEDDNVTVLLNMLEQERLNKLKDEY